MQSWHGRWAEEGSLGESDCPEGIAPSWKGLLMILPILPSQDPFGKDRLNTCCLIIRMQCYVTTTEVALFQNMKIIYVEGVLLKVKYSTIKYVTSERVDACI